MANKPFDRRVLRRVERVVSDDHNNAATWAHYSNMERARRLLEYQLGDGSNADGDQYDTQTCFVGEGLRVKATTPGLSVVVKAGLGYVIDGTTNDNIGSGDAVPMYGVSDTTRLHPLYLSADETITVPAADPTNPRIDIVEIKLGVRQDDPDTRSILNTSTGIITPQSVNKTLTYDLSGTSTVNGAGYINYKTGTPAGSPSAPTVTSGYIKIAEVYVPATATSLTNASASAPYNSITDLRVPYMPAGALSFGAQFRVPSASGAVADAVVHSLPPGWKVSLYTVAAPLMAYQLWIVGPQCADFRAIVSLQVATSGGYLAFATPAADDGAVTTASAANRSQLATSASQFPNIYVGNNQPVFTQVFTVSGQDVVGAWNIDATGVMSNPHYLNFTGTIFRYKATT